MRLGIILGLVVLLPACGDVGSFTPDRAMKESTVESADPIEVYFTSGTPQAEKTAAAWDLGERCARVIESARESLLVCGHEIDNLAIISAIVSAHRRGVSVRVVTEKDYSDEIGPRMLRQAGVGVLCDNRSALMHNKFLVVDQQRVWTGSMNFTDNGVHKNDNNVVVFRSRELAANYAEKFRWFWEDQKFGGAPSKGHRIPYPDVMVNGVRVENFFSTHDKVDEKLIAAVNRARRSIKFLAFSFTHDGVAAAIARRAGEGVAVMGVFESRQNSRYSEFNRLASVPNVEVLLDGNRYNMHHKVMIIDDELVVTGSYNFSASATSDNDENVVFIHSSRVARQFDAEFQRVWWLAQRALARVEEATMRR